MKKGIIGIVRPEVITRTAVKAVCCLLASCLYDPGPETIRITPNVPLLLS